MPTLPQFYDAADATLLSALINAPVEAGITYDLPDAHLWNDKGGTSGATTSRNPRLRVVVVDGAAKVSHGFAILDEKWLQVRVVGKTATGDPTMADQISGFTPIGAGEEFLLADIPANTARHLEMRIVSPAGAKTASPELYLEYIDDETSVVLPFRLGTFFAGVIPDVRDASIRRLRRGGAIVTDASAAIVIAPLSLAYAGAIANAVEQELTLNQNDSAAAALAAGQSYYAVISVGSAGVAVATKGVKGAAPAKPLAPAGNVHLGYVQVHYQAGASVINAGDVDIAGVVYGELLITDAGGLLVSVGAGRAIGGSLQPFYGSRSRLVMNASETNYVSMLSDGSFNVSSTPELQPGATLLAAVVTDAVSVTSIDTRVRTWADRAIVELPVVLRFSGTPAVADVSPLELVALDALLESVDVVVGKKGTGGTAGRWKFDVLVWPPGTDTSAAGTSIYTSSGTHDHRPVVAFNANLSAGNNAHEVVRIARNSAVAFSVVEIPDNVGADDFFMTLRLRAQ